MHGGDGPSDVGQASLPFRSAWRSKLPASVRTAHSCDISTSPVQWPGRRRVTLSLWRVSMTAGESTRHTGVTSLLVQTASVKAATTTRHTRAYDAEYFVLFRPFITIGFRGRVGHSWRHGAGVSSALGHIAAVALSPG